MLIPLGVFAASGGAPKYLYWASINADPFGRNRTAGKVGYKGGNTSEDFYVPEAFDNPSGPDQAYVTHYDKYGKIVAVNSLQNGYGSPIVPRRVVSSYAGFSARLVGHNYVESGYAAMATNIYGGTSGPSSIDDYWGIRVAGANTFGKNATWSSGSTIASVGVTGDKGYFAKHSQYDDLSGVYQRLSVTSSTEAVGSEQGNYHIAASAIGTAPNQSCLLTRFNDTGDTVVWSKQYNDIRQAGELTTYYHPRLFAYAFGISAMVYQQWNTSTGVVFATLRLLENGNYASVSAPNNFGHPILSYEVGSAARIVKLNDSTSVSWIRTVTTTNGFVPGTTSVERRLNSEDGFVFSATVEAGGGKPRRSLVLRLPANGSLIGSYVIDDQTVSYSAASVSTSTSILSNTTTSATWASVAAAQERPYTSTNTISKEQELLGIQEA